MFIKTIDEEIIFWLSPEIPFEIVIKEEKTIYLVCIIVNVNGIKKEYTVGAYRLKEEAQSGIELFINNFGKDNKHTYTWTHKFKNCYLLDELEKAKSAVEK